jgi:hypothetical protein
MRTFRPAPDLRNCILLMIAVAGLIASCKTSGPTSRTPAPSPPQSTVPEKKPDPVVTSPPVKKMTRLRIALVMPFELKENFAEDSIHGGLAEIAITNGSQAALHFYEGAKLATDSLLNDSIAVVVSGVEAPVDSLAAARLFGGASLRDFDYVIAGIQPALASAAATAAGKSGINLVLTQAPNAAVIASHPNVALAGASTFTQCREMAGWIAANYPASQVVLVYRQTRRENELAGIFRDALVAVPDRTPPRDFDATTRPLEELKSQLPADKRIVVIVASSDEAFVKNTLSQINDFMMSGIYICGLPTWPSFESIDFMNLENLKFFLFDNNFVDLGDPKVTAFRKLFISKYAADPLPQAFNGFELVYGLGKHSPEKKGPLCDQLTTAFKNSEQYRFLPPVNGSGCENNRISILTIEDYQLKKAKP